MRRITLYILIYCGKFVLYFLSWMKPSPVTIVEGSVLDSLIKKYPSPPTPPTADNTSVQTKQITRNRKRPRQRRRITADRKCRVGREISTLSAVQVSAGNGAVHRGVVISIILIVFGARFRPNNSRNQFNLTYCQTL